jgi:putative transcriptional regulator
MEILPGLYFSAQREHLEKLISRPGEQLRLFVGHAGWGDGQLENEMKVGSWLTRPATIDYVFYDESELWKRVARDIGESLLLETLKVDPKVIPPDPRVN